jgi:hypothetical protein
MKEINSVYFAGSIINNISNGVVEDSETKLNDRTPLHNCEIAESQL